MNPCRNPLPAALIVAAMVLLSAAWMRGAEYDEQYTLFLTSGDARPAWPAHPFAAGEVRRLQAGHAGFATIAHDLRTTDVHPPLYFWVVGGWRMLFGTSLFAARLASVIFSLAALGIVALIARLVGIPAATATLLTVGCYGFVYTGTVARRFALANLLTLAGVAVLLCAEQRTSAWIALAAGLLLGAATFSNYLAAFVACCLSALADPAPWSPVAVRRDRIGRLAAGRSLVLSGAAAKPRRTVRSVRRHVGHHAARTVRRRQHGGRIAALCQRAGRRCRGDRACSAAARACRPDDLAMARHCHARRPSAADHGRCAPSGCCCSALVFHSTPIELRYLAFATPFVALLLAGAVASLPRRPRHVACGLVLAVQALSLGGLMTRQETMQPARATAIAAASLAGNGVVLLPRGNDGVGIVGAFAIEAPPTLRLMIVGKDQAVDEVRARAGGFHRVVLALIGQDDESRATLPGHAAGLRRSMLARGRRGIQCRRLRVGVRGRVIDRLGQAGNLGLPYG